MIEKKILLNGFNDLNSSEWNEVCSFNDELKNDTMKQILFMLSFVSFCLAASAQQVKEKTKREYKSPSTETKVVSTSSHNAYATHPSAHYTSQKHHAHHNYRVHHAIHNKHHIHKKHYAVHHHTHYKKVKVKHSPGEYKSVHKV